MVFLHNETSIVAKVLVQDGDKSSYEDGIPLTGHIKPLSIDDTTFGTTKTTGSPYKFTAQGLHEFDNGEKITIGDVIYSISASKQYKGITFNTTKILLVTEE